MFSFVPAAAPRPVSLRLPVPGYRNRPSSCRSAIEHVGILLERVEHAVAVMRVDVDVGDAPDAVQPARGLDRDAAVVEYAEPGRAVARRVMQAADRNERVPLAARATIAASASSVPPTTVAAASYTPGNAGVSPASSKPLPSFDSRMTRSTYCGVWKYSSSARVATRGLRRSSRGTTAERSSSAMNAP